MSRSVPSLLGAVALSALAAASQDAHALGASANLDWSRLSISVTDSNAADGVTAGYALDGFGAFASDCLGGAPFCPGGGFAHASDWSSSGELTPASGGMSGIARFDAGSTFASINGFSPSEHRSTSAGRSAMLHLTGASHVQITLPYTLTIDASGTSALHGSFAFGGLQLAGYADAVYFISSPWDGTTTRSGVFTLNYHHAGSSSWFLLYGNAFARLDHEPILPPVVAVPEPSTYALMLGGVALLAGWRRRLA